MTLTNLVERLRNLADGEAHDQTVRCEVMRIFGGDGDGHTFTACTILADLVEDFQELFKWSMANGPDWGTDKDADAVRQDASITLMQLDREKK